LNSSQKTTALKESLTVATTPGMLPSFHNTTDTNKTSAKYLKKYPSLKEKLLLEKRNAKQMPPQEKQESLTSSNNNYHELLELLKSKKNIQ
jgi:hypothetical protein